VGRLQNNKEFKDFVHFVALNQSDPSKLKGILNDIVQQIDTGMNKFQPSEIKSLFIKKSALESFIK
jgi:hypothetical protein